VIAGRKSPTELRYGRLAGASRGKQGNDHGFSPGDVTATKRPPTYP